MVSGEAVGVTACAVEPSPISVENEAALLRRAASAGGAGLPCDLRGSFGGEGTCVLSASEPGEGQGDGQVHSVVGLRGAHMSR